MPPPLGLVNLSVADLIAEAGGDPWKINDDLQAGDPPGAINAQADAFHTAAGAATEIESDFKAAKERFEKGWQHSGAQHPITDSAEVTRATQTLHLQKPPQLATIALNLENVATALVAAQRACDADIAALDTFLHGADDAIGAAKATNQDTRALHDAAVATMRITLGEVQGSRDTYVNAMAAAAESSMAAIPGEGGPQAAGGVDGGVGADRDQGRCGDRRSGCSGRRDRRWRAADDVEDDRGLSRYRPGCGRPPRPVEMVGGSEDRRCRVERIFPGRRVGRCGQRGAFGDVRYS